MKRIIRAFHRFLGYFKKNVVFRNFSYSNWENLCYNETARREGLGKGGLHMVSVQALCNTILKKSFDEGVRVTPMKLQKLLYFIYRSYLQKFGQSLFSEDFLAWQYGPVLRSVYDEFKVYGANPITKFAKTATGDVFVINECASEAVTECINEVWSKYRYKTGIELSNITHKSGGAWIKAYANDYPALKDADIKDDHVS